MWRRYGDAFYAGLVLFVFTIEALGLTGLTWAFVLNDTWGDTSVGLWRVLLGAIALTALALMVLTAYTLGYEAFGERREQQRARDQVTWGHRWVAVLNGAEPVPEDVPEVGIDALLGLRELLRGPEGEQVRAVLDELRVVPELATIAKDRRRGWRRRVPLGARRLTSRLKALDWLGRARHPEAFDSLLILTADSNPTIVAMAYRALARSASAFTDADGREWAASSLRYLMEKGEVPKGVLEETLLLLEDMAPLLIEEMLTTPPERAEYLLPLVLDAAGRLQLTELVELVAAQVKHPSDEVRAAALRALGFIGTVPDSIELDALRALRDPSEIVRIQAARLGYALRSELVLPELWELLGSDSWWVRRATAWAHVRIGPEGMRQLELAAHSHDDRFARHMASQVLFDTGRLDADRVFELRAVG